MATAFAAQKPPLGQKMPQAWSRLENRPLSRRMHREKCRPLLRLASGAPVFANGAVTAAMGYAFNSLGSQQADEYTDAEQAALDRYNALHGELRQRAIDNPEGVLDLSGEEFKIIVDWIYLRTSRQGLAPFGSQSFENHFGAYDTFLHGNALLTGRQFNVGGSVIAEGGHINYIAVGMLAAHYGPNVEQMIPGLVVAHNSRQIYQGEGLRNVNDIGPGTRWALTGASLYRRLSR